jgi:hypothetical protein
MIRSVVQRSALRTLLLAVLCLSVLALAAATLDTTQTDGSGFGTGGDGGDRGDGGGPTPQPQQPRDPRTTGEPSENERYELCAPWVKEPPVIIGVVVAAILTFLALLRWYDEFVAVAGTLIVFGPITLLMLVAAECGLETPDPNPSSNVTGGNGTSGGGSAGGSGSGVPDPSLPLIAIVAIGVLIALVAVAYYLTGDDTAGTGGEESEDAEAEDDSAIDATDVAEVGRLAGEAADRIESAGDFENQVYRAWQEMTRPLNVDRPRSSSPGEFARAAAAAGMDRGSVDRLTELFDEVRYGGFEAPPEREREAVSLLRSIEEQYADVETLAGPADAADDGDDPEGSDG